MIDLKGRDILSVSDLSREEIFFFLKRTKELKTSVKNKKDTLSGRILGLLFEKASTRTRVSFEAAMGQLGGDVNALVLRTYKHETSREFAEYCAIPVINGLSDLEHPTQILCDLYTIREASDQFEGLNLAWIGDGNNVCNSWLLGAGIMGMNLSVATPAGYEPNKEILERARKLANESGSKIEVTRDPRAAARHADILYTDVWTSMGQEEEAEKRMKAFRGYQINRDLLKVAREDVLVMHCLPAHRGMEITDDVLEGPKSIVWKQAENKLHGAKAFLSLVID